MSELREFLGKHNMGIGTLAKLIGLKSDTVSRYEKDPGKCMPENRIKIEVALKMIEEENWVRPVLNKHDIVNVETAYCVRENHFRNVVIFERDFKKNYRERLSSYSRLKQAVLWKR